MRWRVVRGPIQHDGRRYAAGDEMGADAARIQHLISRGRVAPIDETPSVLSSALSPDPPPPAAAPPPKPRPRRKPRAKKGAK